MDTKKVATGLKIFGAVLFVLCLGGLIWSLFRPAVTHGPPVPEPAPMGSSKKTG